MAVAVKKSVGFFNGLQNYNWIVSLYYAGQSKTNIQ